MVRTASSPGWGFNVRCFVINLDRDEARLDWMTRAFERMDLAFERFPAIDKSTLDKNVVEQFAGPPSKGWTDGQIACFLSHIELWKRIASGDEPYAAIFEDDVHFSPDAARFLRNSSWIPQSVELVKIETTLTPVRLSRADHLVMGHRLHPLRSYHNGTAGYVISKERAAKLLAAVTTIDRPVDDFMFDRGYDPSCRQLVPALCIQDMFLPTAVPFLASGQSVGIAAVRAGRWAPRPPLRSRLPREIKRVWRQITSDYGAPVSIELTPTN